MTLPHIFGLRTLPLFVLSYPLRPLFIPGFIAIAMMGRFTLFKRVLYRPPKGATEFLFQMPYRLVIGLPFLMLCALVGEIEAP